MPMLVPQNQFVNLFLKLSCVYFCDTDKKVQLQIQNLKLLYFKFTMAINCNFVFTEHLKILKEKKTDTKMSKSQGNQPRDGQ